MSTIVQDRITKHQKLYTLSYNRVFYSVHAVKATGSSQDAEIMFLARRKDCELIANIIEGKIP